MISAAITALALVNLCPIQAATGPFFPAHTPLRTCIRLMFQAMVTKFHSPWASSSPRMLTWCQPITCLMMPNTGSAVCLRRASSSPRRGAQLVRHALHGSWFFWLGGIGCKTLHHGQMMRLPLERQQCLNSRIRACLCIGLAALAVVCNQCLYLTQLQR